MTLPKDKAIQAMLLGDWKSAASLNKTLIKEDPEDIDALNRLAYVFTILGKIQDAKSTYRKVLKIDILNQIAMRNIKKLTEMKPRQIARSLSSIKGVNSTFLEETGKTKIISLVNTAQPKIIALLTTGQPVVITIKRSKIFVQDQNNQYLGVLPDDIGRKLIRLIKGGNMYTACIKSATEHNVCVFVKETKRVSKYKNQPSFPQTADQDLGLSKGNKTKIKNYNNLTEEDDDRAYSLEEES
ncbi:MAG: tetratricopeptide repeat protein [bacterium]|nr:tetratricopeptide repeat protein [bacterium]